MHLEWQNYNEIVRAFQHSPANMLPTQSTPISHSYKDSVNETRVSPHIEKTFKSRTRSEMDFFYNTML